MKQRGGKSGGERQSQKFDGRFAPECIDQPRLNKVGIQFFDKAIVPELVKKIPR